MNVYQDEQLAHLRSPEALLKEETLLTADEATYDMKSGKITLMGNVHTTFKNGTELFSKLAFLETHPSLKVTIPRSERISGRKPHPKSPVSFTAYGLEFLENEDRTVHLLQSVRTQIEGKQKTEIVSDQAVFSDAKDSFLFFMNAERIIEQQFVTATQPDLDLKSRKIEFKLSGENSLQEIRALQDVWFKDRHAADKETEGTGGKAVYLMEANQIVLSEFPQLYQDHDTITGDLITYHRDSETVEVTESNAIYNVGKSGSKKP
jgi:lipopolysaccharide transport protein LptA